LGGLVAAGVYYTVFRWAIQQFDFKTPGREAEDTAAAGVAEGEYGMAKSLIRAFGGRHNIATLDACITRLRITVQDMGKVNVDRLKQLGASGVLQVGNSAQAIFGPRSENLKTDMVEYLKVAGPEADEADLPTTVTATVAAPTAPQNVALNADELAHISRMIDALGGKNNIRKVAAAAATRLRLEVADSELVDEAALRTAGVKGIMPLPNSVIHLLVGLNAEQYAKEMKARLAGT
jgi:PTS system glucose-specific IIC component